MGIKDLNRQKHIPHSWVEKLAIKDIPYANQQNSNTETAVGN